MGQVSVTSAVRGLLLKSPEICDCLHFVNYSRLALAMISAVEEKTGRRATQEAVKTAIRRFAEGNKKPGFLGGVRSALRGGRLNLRNNVSVLVLYPGMRTIGKMPELEKRIDRRKGEILHIVAGINCIVLILDDSNYPVAERLMKKDILRGKIGLSAVTITTSPKIATTPGVIAHITALVAREGINVEELESCYTDTILIVQRSDAIRVFNILEDAMSSEGAVKYAGRKKKFGREPLFSAG